MAKTAGQKSRRASQSLSDDFLGLKEDQKYLAFTGRGDADNTVLVANRPGYIYIRIPKKVVTGTLEEYSEAQAFSPTEQRANVPVFVVRSKVNPSRYEVESIWDVGSGQSVVQTAISNITTHHTSHELYSSVGGGDPVMLDTIQSKNLQVTPVTPTSSKVRVGSGWYVWKHGGINWFDGAEVDIAANVPTGTLALNYVSLWLDPNTNEISQNVISTVDDINTNLKLEDVLQWPVEDYIPLAAVRLSSGNYKVGWVDSGAPQIIDMRPHQAMMPRDMLPAGHPLSPGGGYHTGTLEAVHVTYNDSSGTFAGDNVQDILNELRDTARGSSGTIPTEEDDFLVMGATRYNFEGDAFYDMNVIDEGAGKATITGTFDDTQLDRRLNEFYIRKDGNEITIVANPVTDTAPDDDITLKRLTIQKLGSAPTNAAYIAFTNSPGGDTFYLVLEEG